MSEKAVLLNVQKQKFQTIDTRHTQQIMYKAGKKR